jgi:hypothetical protein
MGQRLAPKASRKSARNGAGACRLPFEDDPESCGKASLRLRRVYRRATQWQWRCSFQVQASEVQVPQLEASGTRRSPCPPPLGPRSRPGELRRTRCSLSLAECAACQVLPLRAPVQPERAHSGWRALTESYNGATRSSHRPPRRAGGAQTGRSAHEHYYSSTSWCWARARADPGSAPSCPAGCAGRRAPTRAVRSIARVTPDAPVRRMFYAAQQGCNAKPALQRAGHGRVRGTVTQRAAAGATRSQAHADAANLRRRKSARMRSHAHARTRTHARMRARAHTGTHARARAHTHARARAHMRKHERTHARTHTHVSARPHHVATCFAASQPSVCLGPRKRKRAKPAKQAGKARTGLHA